jgi:hypothetical protein
VLGVIIKKIIMSTTEKIDIQSVFTTDPLYTEYDLNQISFDDAMNILFCVKKSNYDKTHAIDSYCTVCSKETTFYSRDSDEQMLINVVFSMSSSSGNGHIKALEEIGIFERLFFCPRALKDRNHDQTFLFKVLNGKIIKIGQLPSIADLATAETKKYKKINHEIYTELNRAIGLSAHGIGVGAFVYLRRIVEKYIVQKELERLSKANLIQEKDFDNIRFTDKLVILKDSLPDFLINNPKIYSILSKGIHELDEKECRTHFPLLRNAIEIILDEQIEQIEKEKKNQIISIQVNNMK